MENFIIYMVKACGLIALFFLAYHTLLKKETFFTSNRWFLLAGLFTAIALPFIVYTKIIWIEPTPAAEIPARTIDLYQLMQYRQQLAKLPPPEETITINWFDVIGGMYFAGVLLFFVRFVLDFLSIRKVLTRNIIIKDKKFRLIDSDKVMSPFSFFNYIVYNSAILKPEELDSIITHEKVHSSQRHSLDMIISQLFCIVFWFNPFVWMYKKSISQNLEFIADAEATRLLADKQAYQKTLLKITIQPDCIAITNHFYQSLIKKRIVMLNKQQSKKWNSWKYATVLPILAAFMFLFQVKVVAQEKQSGKQPVKITDTKVKFAIDINKDTKDSELEESKNILKEQCNADVSYENLTRNLNKEITSIKVTVKDKGQSQVYEVAGNDPISPFTIEVEQNAAGRNAITFGTGSDDNFIRGRAFIIADDGDLKDLAKEIAKDSARVQRHQIMRSFNSDNMVSPPFPPSGNWSVNTMKIGGTDMLIVINGVKQKKGETAIKIPLGQEISEMNILKGKEAKKKYGKEAKEGAVEITTNHSNNMAFNIGPEAFDFQIQPDMQFDMPMDFDIRIEGLDNIGGNMARVFTDGDNFKVWGEMSEEDMKQVQEELKKAQIELQDLGPRIQESFRKKEMSEDELKSAKVEIEKAKKEIEESRKEMEKARKELETARKKLNKKA